MTTVSWTDVLISAVLVLIALAVSRWWRIPVTKDISFGSVRAFVQLVAVGYALEFIFDLQSVWLILLALMIMITVGAQTAAGRVRQVARAFPIALVAMLTGSFFTLAIMLLLDIITLDARFIIPLGGMIIGNCMNASTLTIDRLASDIRNNRLAVETSLSLGKSWRVASAKYQRDAMNGAMIPIINALKTLGIVALPGAMTGMILAGASPLKAVFLQVIVMFMLLSAVTITSVVTMELTIRRFFTRFHQLIRET